MPRDPLLADTEGVLINFEGMTMSDQGDSKQPSNGGAPKDKANDLVNKATVWCKENPILAVVIVVVALLILWAIL